MDKKTLGWSIVAVAAILATLFFGVNYPIPPAPEPTPELDVLGEFESRSLSRPVQLRDVRILQDLAVGGDAAVTGDVSVGDDLTVTDDFAAGGDVTITGGLEVTGGVTGTNVLTTGNQTVGGVKTFTDTGTFSGAVTVGGGYGSTGCTLSTAGVLQCNGAATFDGAVTTGALTSLTPILTKDANYPVVAADSGAIIKNTALVSATFTLPGAVAGLNYCIFNYAGTDVIIAFTDATDVALNEVNSPGDTVTNTTAYDSICLTAIDATNWITISSVGTWADGTS